MKIINQLQEAFIIAGQRSPLTSIHPFMLYAISPYILDTIRWCLTFSISDLLCHITQLQ